MKGLYTDGFRLADDVEADAGNFVDNFLRMRHEVERQACPVDKWNIEEKALADSRLLAMGKSDDSEKNLRVLNRQICQVETDIIVQDVLDKVLKGK